MQALAETNTAPNRLARCDQSTQHFRVLYIGPCVQQGLCMHSDAMFWHNCVCFDYSLLVERIMKAVQKCLYIAFMPW